MDHGSPKSNRSRNCPASSSSPNPKIRPPFTELLVYLNMDSYLRQLRNVLTNAYKSNQQVEIVIGNEAADLDSVVSALVFAYWKERQAHAVDQSPIAYVPILNIPRNEYRLKTEVRYVLSKVFGEEIENQLIFIDEVQLNTLENRLALTLVDHHKLSTEQLRRYGSVVRRVIDHHADNELEHNSYRQQCQGKEDGFDRYVTVTVGSCSTLVAERVCSSSRQQLDSCVDEKVATLLLSAILIDTSELKDIVKTTDRDKEAVKQLEIWVLQTGRYDRGQLFEEVKRAKNDVSAMTVLEILAKDYKAIRRASDAPATVAVSSIGMSTVPLSYEALVGHIPNGQTSASDLRQGLEQFRAQKQVDALVLSCVNKEPNLPKDRVKQVVVYCGDESGQEKICHALSKINGLGLITADSGKGVPIRVYWQGNPGLSRKQLLPALEDMLNGRVGETSDSSSIACSPKSDPSSPSTSADDNGVGQPSPSVYSNPSPAHGAQAPGESSTSAGQQQQGGPTTGSRSKRFLDSTDLARSFSVTYDDDEGDYYLGAGSSRQKSSWQNDVDAVGQLGWIGDNRLSSIASGDYEFDHRLTDDSYSPSTTEEETRHYPTVNTAYATSSYEGGGGAGVANGSGNTQEESAATLSGVPDLLDSRENLADVVAGISEDTPDLLVDYHSPSSVADTPFPVFSKRTYDECGDIDLLRGTEARGARGFMQNDTASSDSQYHDVCAAIAAVEPSFSSYPPDIAIHYRAEENVASPLFQKEAIKREWSEPQQFEFSTDPSPADGRSRADTPPSSMSHVDDEEDELQIRGRNFTVGEEAAEKSSGVRTPPNTFAEHYLDDAIAASNTSGRRQSQQSDLEPELLRFKLKGAQFFMTEELAAPSPSSSSALCFKGSVPGTPPNSFIGTPVTSMMEMAAAAESSWSTYQTARRGSQLEPESLRQRVTELSKELPPEDVEYQGAGRSFMDKESRLDSAFDTAAVASGDEPYQDQYSDMSSIFLDHFAEEIADTVLTKALADVFYPEVADDEGLVNPGFNSGSTATPSPLSPTKEGVFPDLTTAERSLPDVLSENFPSPVTSGVPRTGANKTPLSARSSSDLLDAHGRGLPFDLVSCASAASFGRESTVAHADSTEFNIGGRRLDGAKGVGDRDPRIQTDFNDEGDDSQVSDFVDDGPSNAENAGGGFGDENGFQSGVSGVQWEEEGYPALVDIHQQDSTRLFSDEPGGFNELGPVPSRPAGETGIADVVPFSVSPPDARRKKTFGDEQDDESQPTESGPDSPDAQSVDGLPSLEDGEGTSNVVDKTGGDGLEWENDTPVLSPQKQTSQQWAAAAADMAEERRWRTVVINGAEHQVDMAAVEPYRRVISHGGYYGEGLNAIAVFAACYLPSRHEPDYHYIMDNLFLYTVSMLDTLVAEDYVIVYFQGGSTSYQMPPFSWLRKCYHLIDRRHVSHTEVGLDRRLRKNLKAIYLVHPTLWLKTVVTMTKLFISSKFSKKVYFIQALNDLGKLICMDQVEIPDEVLKHDHERVFARTYISGSTTSVNAGRSASRRPTDANDDGSNRRTSTAAAAASASTKHGAEH